MTGPVGSLDPSPFGAFGAFGAVLTTPLHPARNTTLLAINTIPAASVAANPRAKTARRQNAANRP